VGTKLHGVTKTEQTQKMKTEIVLVNEHGLSELQMKQAEQLCQKHQPIANLAKEVNLAEGDLKHKYVQLCHEIRKSGMNAKEFSLILRTQGFYPSRISEIKKVCSLPEEVFSKYLAGDIGRQMAIKIARSGADNVDEARGVNEQGDDEMPKVGTEQADGAPVKSVMPIVDPILPKLAKMLKMHKLAPGKHTTLVEVDDYLVQVLFTVKGRD